MDDPKAPAKPDLQPMQRRASDLRRVSQQLQSMITMLQEDRKRLEGRLRVTTGGDPGEAGPAARPGLAPQPLPEPERLRIELERSRAEARRLREDEGRLRSRLDEIEELHRGVCDELVFLQEQVAHSVGLHIALRRLHEAADRSDVVAAILDIIVNIVGSEHLAVLAPGPRGGLELTGDMCGSDPLRDVDRPALEAAMERGEILVGAGAADAVPGTLACVPLRARGRVAGAILLFGLLPQKQALGPQDMEVLQLLQMHGALALQATAPGGAAHEDR